jgi:predicted XRE-type DNA-binding protein
MAVINTNYLALVSQFGLDALVKMAAAAGLHIEMRVLDHASA